MPRATVSATAEEIKIPVTENRFGKSNKQMAGKTSVLNVDNIAEVAPSFSAVKNADEKIL